MSKKDIITTTREQQQRYLMNQAKIGIITKGRQWEARVDTISLLKSLRNDSDNILKDEFDEESKKFYGKGVLEVLSDFRNAIADLVAYYSDIKKKVISEEDVSSERFFGYKEALSKCYKYLFLVDEIIVFLQKGTDFEELTIPSPYWGYVSEKEIIMPPSETEEYRRPSWEEKEGSSEDEPSEE